MPQAVRAGWPPPGRQRRAWLPGTGVVEGSSGRLGLQLQVSGSRLLPRKSRSAADGPPVLWPPRRARALVLCSVLGAPGTQEVLHELSVG